MNIAEQLEQNEKYDEAYAEYKKMLVNKEGDVEILTRLAHLSMILDKKDEARIYYSRILEVDPSNILAHEQLLDLFINEDKFKYYLLRGNMHALQQQLSYAGSDYKKAISHAKDQQEALPARYLYAGLCEGIGKYNDAIDEYLKIADFDEKNPMVFLKLAELYEKTEGIISAIQTLERAKRDYGFNDFDEVLAGYYIRNSQPDKALEITKNDLTKARAMFDLNRNDEGYEILKKIQPEYNKNKIFHSLMAQYYFQKDMYDEAFQSIENYASMDPNSPLIYQMRALIYEKLGDNKKAVSDYNKAIELHPNDPEFYFERGRCYQALNDNEKALADFNKALQLNPYLNKAYLSRGKFYQALGEEEKAQADFAKAKELGFDG